MLTTPDLSRSGGDTNILGSHHLCTGPTCLLTGHSVDHSRCVTGDGAVDGEQLSSTVTGVRCTVRTVHTAGTVGPAIALLEPLTSLSPSKSVGGWRNLAAAEDITQGLSPCVGHHGGSAM